MNNLIIKNLKNNWIIYIIVLQPLLDILSYFQSKQMGTSYSWIIRISILIFTFMVCFIKSSNKKKLLLKILPFALFFIFHIFNLYRISKLNLILDIKYFILVFQMPILCISLIDYIKSTNYDLNKIKNAIFCNLVIIATSIFISYITGTYEHTYVSIGILGWFSGSNTPSLILCALSPWALYMLSNSKKIWLYFLGSLAVFALLYTNATKACYLTLLASFFLVLFTLILSKKETKKVPKIIISSFFIILSIILYNFSFTSSKELTANEVTKENENDIKSVVNINEIENIDFNNININDDDLILKILNTSYLYTRIIRIHGEKPVIDIMKPYLSAYALSNNRLSKVINSKIEFNNSDLLTKCLGIGYSRISVQELDLENDLQAIFFYYGYVGFSLYLAFILYFIIKAIIVFFKNFKSAIYDEELITLLFLILLLLAGGEYSGAFLRKPNANIYLSLYLLLLYFKLNRYIGRTKLDKKKITFLLLHLGYGGIETATINTANALSEKYNVELISFYNLKDNQTSYINKNIKIKYLYNGEPNKTEFKNAVKQKNIIEIFKEGLRSANILTKKKFLVKKEILNSDSFALISTRYDFSILLSKYGRRDVIKIAQEHHHHNNNKKYINILKHKYNNIDYLFALTESLKNDYIKFLRRNNHTKIEVVPNMLSNNSCPSSNLNNKNIISVCRLDSGKRINELIDIFSKIENKDSKLYIIGDGVEKDNLKTQIKNLHLKNRIIMTGYLSKEEQEKYWLDSCLYAMTSISEGLPMVLLEAMQHSIPCIAYRTESGITDIIKNNKNGYIIDNRSSDDYIKAINSLLSDSIKLKELSIYAKEYSCNFSKDNILKLWYKVLENRG
mgnify:FL=1